MRRLISDRVTKWMGMMLLGATVVLTGCQSNNLAQTKVGPSAIGPGAQSTVLGHTDRVYNYTSNIHLDVAIPVFDPGIPRDYDEVEEQNIWPQLRRAESNRFAMATKKALEKTKAFGSVSVVPTPDATAEVFVLGRIEMSNSEDIELAITVMDISGKVWSSKSFEHRVKAGFFRDKQNDDKDPYEPIFAQVASHVYDLLIAKSDQQKQDLQQIADIRFAQYFSPESFTKHLIQDKKGVLSLASLPSGQDAMLKRIEPLRVKDQMFVDRIQAEYEGFSKKTDESYRIWQESTLPNAKAAREAETEATVKGFLGAGLAILSVAGGSRPDLNTAEKVATGVSALTSAYFIKESFAQSKEAKAHQARLEEAGANLDIEMDDHVMALQGETIELTGNAQEQYVQWKAHLKKLYAMEATPSKQL